jgi:tetratricopeptide (TPR) repeat protein
VSAEKIAQFLALKEAHPQSEMPRWTLATTYAGAGRHEEAIAEFTELVAMKPDYCVAYLHWGSSLLALDRPEDALVPLERARELAIDQDHTAPRQEAEMLLEAAREELE